MNRILLLLIVLLSACKNKQNVNGFYTSKGDFDMGRIPLIKPYEATVPSPGHNDWIIGSIDTTQVPVTIPGTKQVRVIGDSVILAHALHTTLNYQEVNEAWFVILPKRRLLKGFKKHHKYVAYIRGLRIMVEPHLHDIDHVFNYFDTYDYIDWNKIQ